MSKKNEVNRSQKKNLGILQLPVDFWENRELIWNLAKSDFKARFASSYLGTFWAFVQPVITVLIYVFVFQVGFKSGDTSTGYPYLLYLVSGICPWFFFSEAWMNATGCLVEYSYLVKKVVFKIDVLPMIKILSSLFVHVFFIFFALLTRFSSIVLDIFPGKSSNRKLSVFPVCIFLSLSDFPCTISVTVSPVFSRSFLNSDEPLFNLRVADSH